MAGDMEITVDLAEINASIDKLLKVGKTRDLMENIGGIFRDETLRNFDREQAPDGSKWKKSRRAKSQGGQTLRDTSVLRNSINYRVTSDTEVEIGTNVPYGPVHQYGAVVNAKTSKYLSFAIAGGWAKKKSVTIPARPFIGINKRIVDKINNEIERQIAKHLA